MIVDDAGQLAGIFTDSDLARLLEANRDAAIDGPLSTVMTHSPTTVAVGQSLSHACDLLAQRKLSELPVVDSTRQPVGLIDITDVLGIEPDAIEVQSPGEVQGPRSKVQSLMAPNQLWTLDFGLWTRPGKSSD
jgi:arabinose-5-phosphate isomerase